MQKTTSFIRRLSTCLQVRVHVIVKQSSRKYHEAEEICEQEKLNYVILIHTTICSGAVDTKQALLIQLLHVFQ
jgi:hypothetical protein